MTDLEELRERLRHDRPVPWEQLPDFALYMDQVLSYMDRQVIRFTPDDVLTSAMVNNYTKNGLVPRAGGKKYDREHLAYLTAICILKRVMSTRDMDLLIREELQGRPVADGYAAFCNSLDKALSITAEEMDRRGEDDTLADAAIHFALLSYAAGVASSRYVMLLRNEKEREQVRKPGRGKPGRNTRKDTAGQGSEPSGKDSVAQSTGAEKSGKESSAQGTGTDKSVVQASGAEKSGKESAGQGINGTDSGQNANGNQSGQNNYGKQDAAGVPTSEKERT